jgi:hypothetical protein
VPSLLPGLKELLVKEYPKERVSSQHRDDPGISAERLTSGLTDDDVGTIIGIWIALMIVGVATFIICVSLLLLLTRAIALFWLHFSPP